MTAPILERKRIRLKVEADKWTNALDVRAAATPRMYRGNDCQFEIGLFWDDSLIDASNISSLTLSIWTADRKHRKASKTIAAEHITVLPSPEGWDAGSAQHVIIPFTGVEMNWTISEGKIEEHFFLVVAGLTNSSPGCEITYGTSVFTLVEDAEGGAGVTPVNDPRYYTQAEADARFVPLYGDQARWRWRNGGWEYLFQEDSRWRALAPRIIDGHPVIAWSDPL